MTRPAVLLLLLAAVVWLLVPGARMASGAVVASATAVLAWFAFTWHRRWRRRHTLDSLRQLSPVRFEHQVAAWLARDGWLVEERGGKGDEGLDLVAFQGDEVVAVQCKRYAEKHAVTPAQVREFYGAATAIGATRAVLVTTGRYSAAAEAWCGTLPPGGPRMRLAGPTDLPLRLGAGARPPSRGRRAS